MKVTFRLPDGNERTVEFTKQRNILEAAEDAGLELPWSCRSGSCSDCAARVLCGVVNQVGVTYLHQDAVDGGFCLTCRSRPATDCLVETHQRRTLKLLYPTHHGVAALAHR